MDPVRGRGEKFANGTKVREHEVDVRERAAFADGTEQMHCDKLSIEVRINTSTAVRQNSGWMCCLKMVVKRQEIFFIAKVRHSEQNDP